MLNTSTTTAHRILLLRTRTRTLHTTSLRLRAPIPPPPLSRPGPPSLPKAEQDEFDALVRRAESGQFGDVGVADMKDALRKAGSTTPNPTTTSTPLAAAAAQPQQHPDLRKQAAPQFEGEVNPMTGEVGGPKRDPFVAGEGDWQYSGRVTDF
ncbi:hypothetical protein QFC21_006507 [Naganishia friedmannii]|uniref:Uncharacterized protein n=1 Tax=Naganishia friedmannii TaxID=89922 RepID=A0ACC2V1I0_9TREE|nr:hypothetical protein QFC21_006507 [Naganishia friedmannii]